MDSDNVVHHQCPCCVALMWQVGARYCATSAVWWWHHLLGTTTIVVPVIGSSGMGMFSVVLWWLAASMWQALIVFWGW
jgi:hypothetical protein